MAKLTGALARRKRRPTPKTGPAGRAYDLCHRAWRAGVVVRWHIMEAPDGADDKMANRPWSLDVGNGRIDGLTIAQVDEIVTEALTAAGIDNVEWGESWLGYRSILVERSTGSLKLVA